MSPRVYLDSTFKQNRLVKELGAKFEAQQSRWYVDHPIAFRKCAEFIPPGTVCPFPKREWRDYTYEQRKTARALNCEFDREWKCWYQVKDTKPSEDDSWLFDDAILIEHM